MKKILLSLGMVAVLAAFTACNSGTENKENTDTKTEKATQSADEGKCGEGKSEAKPDKFAAIDTDGNGEISLEELKVHALNEFAEKDSDSDGKITKEECGHFDMLNADGDEFVTKEEFENGFDKIFNSMDTDENGVVSKEEMKAHMEEETAGESKCGDGKCGDGKCGGK